LSPSSRLVIFFFCGTIETEPAAGDWSLRNYLILGPPPSPFCFLPPAGGPSQPRPGFNSRLWTRTQPPSSPVVPPVGRLSVICEALLASYASPHVFPRPPGAATIRPLDSQAHRISGFGLTGTSYTGSSPLKTLALFRHIAQFSPQKSRFGFFFLKFPGLHLVLGTGSVPAFTPLDGF